MTDDPSIFRVAHDGFELRVLHWPAHPEVEEKEGCALIVHGLGEHAGRYKGVAAMLAQLGYEVFAWDHQGFGESTGKAGDIKSVTSLLGEIDTILRHCQSHSEDYPGILPVLLYGHSMGAVLVLDYLHQLSLGQRILPSTVLLQGAIVTSPSLQLAFQPPRVLVALADWLVKIAPHFRTKNDLELAALSRSEQVVIDYQQDPLNHDQVSLLLGHYLISVGSKLLTPHWSPSVPLLLMHGSGDRICDVEGSRQLSQLASDQITYKEWEGAFHELHHDLVAEEVLAFAKTWIRSELIEGH